MKKFDINSKKVFLYSIILHVKSDEGSGILLPIAEALLCRHYENDFKRFLLDLKTFCLIKGINWPICKRVVLDWSWMLINACIKVFNNDISTLSSYLSKCYSILNKKTPLNIVIIQLCCCHMTKTIKKDVKIYAKNDHQLNMFTSFLLRAINISKIQDIWVWFRNLCIILLSASDNIIVKDAIKHIMKLNALESDTENTGNIKAEASGPKQAYYLKSPFYIKCNQIYLSVKKNAEKSKENNSPINNLENEKFLRLILTKYMPYVPLWTNIMGKLINDGHSRVSNSPVEGYFSILKNNLLKDKKNIRASEYVRTSKDFVHAKLKELDNKYGIFEDNSKKRKQHNLIEETWKKTPQKIKEKLNKTIVHGEKDLKKMEVQFYTSERFPRKIKDTKIIIGDYKHIYTNLYGEPKSYHTRLYI